MTQNQPPPDLARLARLLCASLDAGAVSEEAVSMARSAFPKACSLRVSLLVKQGDIVVSTANLLRPGPFNLSLNPAAATCAGAALHSRKLTLASQQHSRQAAIYDLDSPLAAAVPLFVAGSEWPRDGKAEAAGGQPAAGQAMQDGVQPRPAPDQPAAPDGAAGEEGPPGGEPAGHPPVKQQQEQRGEHQQQEQRGEQQDGQQHSAPGEAAGSVYLGFLQPQDVDRAHLHSLLLLARSLAPVAGPAAERCVYAAQVVLGYIHPGEEPGEGLEGSEEDEETSAGESCSSEEEQEEEEKDARGQWQAGVCDDRGSGRPDDPGPSAGALLAAVGGPAQGAGQEGGAKQQADPKALLEAQQSSSRLPDEPRAAARQAAAAAAAGEAPQPARPGPGTASNSQVPLGSKAAGLSHAAGPAEPSSPRQKRGSTSAAEAGPAKGAGLSEGKRAGGPAALARPTLQQAGTSRLTLRFADPALEERFSRWYSGSLWKLDAISMALMLLSHVLLCVSSAGWGGFLSAGEVNWQWLLGIIPAALLVLLLVDHRSYLRWREELLVLLNAYVTAWQLAARRGWVEVSPPVAPGFYEARLPWLALHAMYLDSFMYLLVLAAACQMRFALHAPVQLLNFAAASLLFPAVCHDQLSAAGGPAGHTALQLCLLRLGAKVFLFAVVLPLMALRKMELGARAVFLHRWDAASG